MSDIRNLHKKKVFWGAGAVANRVLSTNMQKDEISFFIDRNLKRKEFLGKKVLHPQDINNWHELFVYVPYTIYSEIVPFLQNQGLIENVDYVSCGRFDTQMTIEEIQNDLNRAVTDLKKAVSIWRNSTVVFFDRLVTFKLYTDFFVQLRKNGIFFNIITHDYWGGKEDIKRIFDADSIVHPKIFHSRTKILNNIQLEKKIKEEISENPFLVSIANHIYYYTGDRNVTDCYYQVKCFAEYLDVFFDYIQPNAVLCSTTVTPPHALLAHMCRERNIPVVSTHEGIIPGTLAFDLHGGEMGASLPAIYVNEFKKLTVSEVDLKEARDVWRYLYESKLNRKRQPQNDNKKILMAKIKIGRPVVFFAGQNDTSSNMVPYTENTRKYHSPMFESSTEAAAYIAQICVDNDWNFIYKPHPMYVKREQVSSLPSNTIFLEMGDINELIDFADVTVTILSATSYNALTRYKPVVMLGYTQLRGKGCTYEAFEKDKIEDTIKEALENGFAQEQQEAFLLHMAQCLKYYLYDDLQERPIRYGRPVPKSIDEFYELERLLQAEGVRRETT